MLDDLLGHLVGEVAFGRLSRSRRAQLLFRLFFGLLGAALGLIGANFFLTGPPDTRNIPMYASTIAVFLSLSAFSLFNIGMARPWKWPGVCFVASFVSMILSRLVFGR